MKNGVYQIRNTTNEKIYIGSSAGRDGLPRRWIDHRKELRGSYHKNQYLQNAWNKYGEDTFIFEILLICDPEDCLMYEQIALDHYRPEYNISPTAGNTLGCKMSDKTKALMSKQRKGVLKTPETRKRMALAQQRSDAIERRKKNLRPRFGKENPMFGRTLSADHRERLSLANRGSNSHKAILTEDQVCEIKKLLRQGVPGATIGRQFGVHRDTIYSIKSGKSWRHV